MGAFRAAASADHVEPAEQPPGERAEPAENHDEERDAAGELPAIDRGEDLAQLHRAAIGDAELDVDLVDRRELADQVAGAIDV
jgi:hypothetical protein